MAVGVGYLFDTAKDIIFPCLGSAVRKGLLGEFIKMVKVVNARMVYPG